MASSSSSEHHQGQRPARLARHNSSFIGAIKNIVKAPLNWFAHQDDSEATPGKRRRQLDHEPTEEFITTQQTDFSMCEDGPAVDSDDDTARQTKRMRLHSPPKRTSQPYLDPPAAALRRADPSRRSSIVPRASSAVLPSSRATLSPRRHIPVTRTMSIDPPRRSLVRRDSSAFNFGPPPSSAESVDYDMAIDSFRDVSMPPSPGRSSRPSFRMRSSVTPQPQQQQPPTRYISEPPPLNTLVSNPVFLHAPAQPTEASAPTTLGSLVQSVKIIKSPTRQHSSLFLASAPVPTNNENKDAPAERALHQLDIYKTPLLPTRMRSSNLPASVTATTTPDMFKSRRKSHLVLMQDDRDRLGRKGSGSGRSPVVNETKPYAGEGGMKKLLARRKQEAEEEETDQKEKQNEDNDDDRTPCTRSRQQSPVTASRIIPDPPAPAGADWFSTAASAPSSSSSGSTLRVGRTTNRTHLARPAKARFSAKFDEEAEIDDTEASRAEKRREMAEEAAKMVPLFKEPPGFSFSLEVPPMEASKDDDPNMFPIPSLPFAISRSSVPSSKDSSPKPFAMSFTAENKETTANQTSSTTPPPLPAPTPEAKAAVSTAPPIAAPALTSNSGLPDFFANSKLLKETKLPTPPVMNFAPTSSVQTTSTMAPFSFGTAPVPAPPAAPAPVVNKPTVELENPFWDGGEKKAVDEPKPTQSLFSGFGKKEGNDTNGASSSSAPPVSFFGGTDSSFTHVAKPSTESTSSTPSVAPPSFSFSNPSASISLFGAAPSTAPGPSKGFEMPAEAKPAPELVAAKPMFGGNFSSSAFGDSSKANSSLFGAPANPQSASAPLAFSFGTPSTQPAAPEKTAPSSQPSFFSAAATTAPAVETPKSLFGGSSNTGFSFAPPTAQKEEVKAPFSFGAPPATPPTSNIAAPKPTAGNAFSFGQPSTTPAATPPISFSFSGGGSTTADVSSKPLFSFGQPSSTAERPVTPPKNSDNEFRMEESPTRELQQANSKPLESRPTIGSGGFSFGGSSSGGSLFGGQSQVSPVAAPAPFSFGSSSFPSKENKPEEPKPFGGFGQAAPPAAPPINTSFSFGQSKPAEDAQRPSSGGGFSFGTTPTSTTGTNAFSFSAPAASNPFGQAAAPGSAPSSPSTFNQPSSFAFGASTPTSNGGFTFGSQPASPAAGGNLSLPPSGFGSGGGFGQAQPSSPFSGPIALAPSTSGGGGGSLFTIGSAPAAAPGGARTIKKLPTRRGGAVKR